MSLKCKQHPKYLAVYRPKCDCLDCWKLYANKLEYVMKLIQKLPQQIRLKA